MKKSVKNDEFLTVKRLLQAYQSTRLNQTYADLKSDPEYEKIGVFFFEKLYAPDDFSFRDTSIKQLHRLLRGKIYKGIILAISEVIELHELTDKLDDRMVEQMIKFDIGPDFTDAEYEKVYRSLDNYNQRLYQIELSTRVTRTFHRLSRKWIVAVSLKTVRTAAHLIGVGGIIDFIYEGYEGFRAMKNIDHFVETVEKRETERHNRIWEEQSK